MCVPEGDSLQSFDECIDGGINSLFSERVGVLRQEFAAREVRPHEPAVGVLVVLSDVVAYFVSGHASESSSDGVGGSYFAHQSHKRLNVHLEHRQNASLWSGARPKMLDFLGGASFRRTTCTARSEAGVQGPCSNEIPRACSSPVSSMCIEARVGRFTSAKL